MYCPKCPGIHLTPQSVDRVVVERCPVCMGRWLEALELEKLLARKPTALLQADRLERVKDTEGLLLCPQCSASQMIKLNSRYRPGTIIDSCVTCFGTWLDGGELAQLTGGPAGAETLRATLGFAPKSSS